MFAPIARIGCPGAARETVMSKLSTLIWIMLGITFAGVFGLVVLATPALAREAAELLPWAALAGFVLAVPASILIARRILAQTGNR
jgi:hypothetical protein